jgi:predicted glycoside hydrolase/deacetylase ChbG (UPF0249 family)
LMCHPGYDDSAPSNAPGPTLSTSSYRAEREVEVALLTHPAVSERAAALGIELVGFDVLA